MRRIALLFLLLVTSHAFAAQAFRFPIPFEPTSLDWSYKRTFYEISVLINVMEGLVDTDENYNPKPALAERWEVSQDRLTYTFYLRPNVKWSDGSVLKAQDFIYSWNRLTNPKTKSEYRDYFSEVKSFKALDDRRIEIKLKRPASNFLQKFRHYVTYPQKPNLKFTLGPYRLANWIKGKELIFERNPNYYGKPAMVGEVHAVIESDTAKLRSMLEKRDIDLLFNVRTSDITHFTADSNNAWYLKQFDALNVTFLSFKVASGPLANVHLRRAIAMALDRTQISLLRSNGKTSAESLIPKNMFGFEPVVLSYNLDQARQELVRAGYPTTHQVPKLKIAYRDHMHDDLARQIRDTLKTTLGLDIELVGLPASSFLSQLSKNHFDLFIEQWWPDDPDSTTFLKRMTSKNPFNRSQWKNVRYDDLIASADSLTNAIDRLKLYVEAQKLLVHDEAVVVPLYHAMTYVLLHNSITRFELSPMLNDLYFKSVELK